MATDVPLPYNTPQYSTSIERINTLDSVEHSLTEVILQNILHMYKWKVTKHLYVR